MVVVKLQYRQVFWGAGKIRRFLVVEVELPLTIFSCNVSSFPLILTRNGLFWGDVFDVLQFAIRGLIIDETIFCGSESAI